MANDLLAEKKPPLHQRVLRVLQFCRNFLELVVIIGVLWWLAIPYYGDWLARLSGGILSGVFGMPLAWATVEPAGVLNTLSYLQFGWSEEAGVMAGTTSDLPVALLVTNMAPYLALVLATPGLSLLRRLIVLAVGAFILFAGHVAFIVLAFYFREQIAKAPDLPSAVAQFYLTLPFVLWIILAYWGKIARYLTEDDAGTDTGTGA
ncbi:MAG: hypothetical protein ACLFTT_12215 [Candidatus Hydrogenedentota bacterium]